MAEGRKQTKRMMELHRLACPAAAVPANPALPPTASPPAHLQFNPAGRCRSESTSQIVRGAPPRYRARSRSRPPGVVNSICNLEALSEPQAAWASGRVRVRISILRLANGWKIMRAAPNPPAVAAGPCRRPSMCQHERKRGGWCTYSHGAWGGKGGSVGWAWLDGSGQYSATLWISARGESSSTDLSKYGLIRPRPSSADSG